MRPSLSLIEESARPSIVNLGKPAAVSASTCTRWASTPTTAAVRDVASMTLPWAGKGESPGGWRQGYGRTRPRWVRNYSLRVDPATRGEAATASVGSAAVDGQRLALGHARPAQTIPGLELLDGRLVLRGNGAQRVPAAHLVGHAPAGIVGRPRARGALRACRPHHGRRPAHRRRARVDRDDQLGALRQGLAFREAVGVGDGRRRRAVHL